MNENIIQPNLDKKQMLEKKLYQLISNKRNVAINWYAMGENFISWDITPMKNKNFTEEFCIWCQLLAREIGDKMQFYCYPESMIMNGWVRISFMF